MERLLELKDALEALDAEDRERARDIAATAESLSDVPPAAKRLLSQAAKKLRQGAEAESTKSAWTAAKRMVTMAANICEQAAPPPVVEVVTRSAEEIIPLDDATDEPETDEPETAEPEPEAPETDAPEPEVAAPVVQLEQSLAEVDFEMLGEFAMETDELTDNAEAALLILEGAPDDREAIATVFRAFHTVKGVAALLNLTLVAQFAHVAESLLSQVRNGELIFTHAIASLALESVDVLRFFNDALRHAGPDDVLHAPSGLETLLRRLANPDVVVRAEDRAAPTPRAARSEGTRSAEASVRVKTKRLDALVDMVGELVIAQAIIMEDDATTESGQLRRKVAQAGKIIRELQDLTMAMRMVPLRATFQKMLRVVRDTSERSGKLARLEQIGGDTEIDRNMVDVLAEPLMHMVRNAVDHGLERPEAREAIGKQREGVVQLSALHAGGSVVITLSDDGGGLRRDAIIDKAMSAGLIETADGLSDGEVHALLFEPGFSTAEEVNDISGRGVGMDVVKRSLESIGGHVSITSTPGQGTTFTIKLPLTLAITDGMIVRVGGERYIVPTLRIRQSFAPRTEELSTLADHGAMVTLRDEILPVYRLDQLLGLPQGTARLEDGILVVVEHSDGPIALQVDELLGQQQVVTKSLGAALGRIRGVSGGAILGDGRVGLILDADGLVSIARGDPGSRQAA